MTATAAALLRPEARAPSRSAARDARLTVSLLLLPLLLAPLPLASVAETPRAWLAAALAAVAAAVLVRAIRLHRPLHLPAGSVALSLFAALALLQLLPIAIGSGERAAALLAGFAPATLSVLPMRTLPRACEVLVAIAIFVAASVLITRRARAMAVCTTLVALGAALSVYGLLMQRSALPPVDQQQTHAVLVATYFNRNHFAGLLEMAALAGLGALCSRHSRGAAPSRQALLGSGIAACLLGLVATESRGGLVALVVGIAVFVALAPARQRKWSFALLAIATILALWLLPDSLLARLQRVPTEISADGSRPDIWRGAVALWLAFPWFGSGLGTYADLSPATQLPQTGGHIEHAHSDPLELLAETGAVGSLLLLAAAAAFFRQAVRRRSCQGERDRAWLAAGTTAAVAAICVHGLVDFNLQIPANAAWFAVLAGVATGMRGGSKRWTLPRPAAAALVLLLGVVAAASVQRGLAGSDDGMQCVITGQQELQRDPAAAARLARAALSRSPLSPSAHLLLGEALTRLRDPAAAAAFAQGLHWSDSGIRAQRQFEAGIACLVGGDLAAAQRWLRDLFACPPSQWPRMLGELHASAPAYELMALLVPPGPPELRQALAAELLRSGDIAGRERELAALRGDAASALLTLADGVLLQRCERDDGKTDPAGPTSLTLTFALAPGAVPTRARLRCIGSEAAMARSFVPAATPLRWDVRLDPTWPPGDYALALDFGNPRLLPLGSVQVPATTLAIGLDTLQHGATSLYWCTVDPYRRKRRDGGLLLRPGDRLWRDLSLPEAAATLILKCGNPGALRLQWAGTTLVADSAANSPVQRLPLPKARAGRLSIENVGEREVLVLDWFVAARRQG